MNKNDLAETSVLSLVARFESKTIELYLKSNSGQLVHLYILSVPLQPAYAVIYGYKTILSPFFTDALKSQYMLGKLIPPPPMSFSKLECQI